jgi:hypothetical protein
LQPCLPIQEQHLLCLALSSSSLAALVTFLVVLIWATVQVPPSFLAHVSPRLVQLLVVLPMQIVLVAVQASVLMALILLIILAG